MSTDLDFVNVPREGYDNNPFYSSFVLPENVEKNQLYALFTKPSRNWNQKYHTILERFEQSELSKEWLEYVSNELVIVNISKLFWYNEYCRKTVRMVDSTFLDKFNHYEYILPNQVYCVPLMSINEIVWNKFVNIINCESYNIKDLGVFYNIKSYLNYVPQMNTNQFIKSLLTSTNMYTHWKDQSTCNFSFTDSFKKRFFNRILSNMSTVKSFMESPNKIIDLVAQARHKQSHYNLADISVNSGVITQTNMPSKWFTTQKMTNVVTELQYLTPTLFNTWLVDHFRTDDSTTYVRNLFHVMANIMTSKNMSHLILNNYNFLKTHRDLLSQHLPIIKYLFSYGFLSLYLNEITNAANMDVNSGCIIDIDTANLWPYFPMSSINTPHPYFPMIVESKELQSSNVVPLPHLNMKAITPITSNLFGVCDKATFVSRKNIFVSSDPQMNILHNILEPNVVCITGSIMTATLTKFNPHLLRNKLMYNITDINAYKKYIGDYYANSDIDMMVCVNSYPEFITKVSTIIDKLSTNIVDVVCGKMATNAEIVANYEIEPLQEGMRKIKNKLIVIKPTHTLVITISPQFANEVIVPKVEQDPMYVEYMANKKTKPNEPEITDEQTKLTQMLNYTVKNVDTAKQYYRVFMDEYYNHLKKEQNSKEQSCTDTLMLDDFCNVDKITTINIMLTPEDHDFTNATSYIIRSSNGGYIRLLNSVKYGLQNIAKSEEMNELIGNELNEMFKTATIDPNTSKPNTIKLVRDLLSGVLVRDIEVFKTRKNNKNAFANMVAQFHVPSVRAYYDGKTVLMTPSCVSSHLTLMSTNLHYFSSNKSLLEIVCKNIDRGFGFSFNQLEKDLFKKFVRNGRKYNNAYMVSVESPAYDNCLNSLIIKTKEHLLNYYKMNMSSSKQYDFLANNYDKLNIINANGTVNPFDYTILTTYLDECMEL